MVGAPTRTVSQSPNACARSTPTLSSSSRRLQFRTNFWRTGTISLRRVQYFGRTHTVSCFRYSSRSTRPCVAISKSYVHYCDMIDLSPLLQTLPTGGWGGGTLDSIRCTWSWPGRGKRHQTPAFVAWHLRHDVLCFWGPCVVVEERTSCRRTNSKSAVESTFPKYRDAVQLSPCRARLVHQLAVEIGYMPEIPASGLSLLVADFEPFLSSRHGSAPARYIICSKGTTCVTW